MKQKKYRFTISSITFPELVSDELKAIKMLIGDFEIISTKKESYGAGVEIVCKQKGAK